MISQVKPWSPFSPSFPCSPFVALIIRENWRLFAVELNCWLKARSIGTGFEPFAKACVTPTGRTP